MDVPDSWVKEVCEKLGIPEPISRAQGANMDEVKIEEALRWAMTLYHEYGTGLEIDPKVNKLISEKATALAVSGQGAEERPAITGPNGECCETCIDEDSPGCGGCGLKNWRPKRLAAPAASLCPGCAHGGQDECSDWEYAQPAPSEEDALNDLKTAIDFYESETKNQWEENHRSPYKPGSFATNSYKAIAALRAQLAERDKVKPLIVSLCDSVCGNAYLGKDAEESLVDKIRDALDGKE